MQLASVKARGMYAPRPIVARAKLGNLNFNRMDRLNNAIDTLVDETCSGLSKPKFARAAARDTGVKLSREDAADIMTEILTAFRAKFVQGVEELVKNSEVEQKLADLKILAGKCKERNEQIGITDGYRPLGVEHDLEGPLYPVVAGFHDTLTNINSTLDENIESSREKLKEAKEQVNTLAKMADSLLNKK
ncbi:hypothetical protein ANCCAN_21235 [Ancylostoma caninum]|uniref:Uncharacterized protein n=1 Tax=Ancylostoma caninum TaxID=29170 RepID=A0A368FLC8_ANCCA|nr:hypothetical protein ANCCAN_21235 [Ancylostoma caninum]